MVSINCRSTLANISDDTTIGRVRDVGTDEASAAAAADLVRARTAAGNDAIERSNVGSSGEVE
eukprot:6178510-Pleurochrysis_carterae.AAC.6